MKVTFEKIDDVYKTVVYDGLYSGKRYRLTVDRDRFDNITIYFYEWDGKTIGKHFEYFEFFDIDVAKQVAEAIKELTKKKYHRKLI